MLKDYGIWLLAVFARGVLVFLFNTGKGRLPKLFLEHGPRYCITAKKRNIVENGLLKSRRRAPPQENVKGSWYQMLEKAAQKAMSSKGDTTLLRDYLSGKEIKASEALILAKK